MKYVLVALMLLLGASSLPSAGDTPSFDAPTPSALESMQRLDADPTSNLLKPGTPQVMQQQCCKICTVGKACGDSCINRDYQCHQPRGCACNG